MGEGKRGVGHAQARGQIGGTAMKAQGRAAARFAYDLDLEPGDAAADAGAESFGACFLCCEARGQAFGASSLAQAIGLLVRGEDAIEKTASKSFHRQLDARDLNQIDSAANDHGSLKKATTSWARGSQVVALQVNAVPLLNSDHARHARTDKFYVREAIPFQEPERLSPVPWAIQMRAVCLEEPSRLVQSLTGAILGCGGWVLSRGASDAGAVNVLFEFERRACVEMYSVLVAAGLDLGAAGHYRFTELCQCTRFSARDCGREIASVDLEIQTLPPQSPLTGPLHGLE